MTTEISTEVVSNEDQKMLAKAAEIFDLFKTASELGYSVTFSPEQLRALVTICEEGYLYKPKKDSL